MRATEFILKMLELHASTIISASKYSPNDLRRIVLSASENKTQLTLVFGKAYSDIFLEELAAIGGEHLCFDLSQD